MILSLQYLAQLGANHLLPLGSCEDRVIIPPEYASSGKLTMRPDIYISGVVLWELITGHRAYDVIPTRL